jgi:hypothetical protein
VNQENERDRVSSCKYDGMDELRELAVRTALFEHLDDLLLASDDDTLGWNQTESFKFNGEVFSIRQAFGRGISKPAELNGALSITTAFTPFGKQPPFEDMAGHDGYPRYKYVRTIRRGRTEWASWMSASARDWMRKHSSYV